MGCRKRVAFRFTMDCFPNSQYQLVHKITGLIVPEVEIIDEYERHKKSVSTKARS